MSSLNHRLNTLYAPNHEGLMVKKVTKPEEDLVRLTMAHMLWEDQFYVDGKTSAQVLLDLVQKVDPVKVAEVAKQARSEFKLRHVPLLLMRGLAKRNALNSEDLTEVIQRPDEMSEFLSIYWKDNKEPLSNQVKKGLAKAFTKFNEYSLAKWDKNSAQISLRDVMFLTHPKPVDKNQENLFKKIANNELETPDTWETQLSAGADKKETFLRLMDERKLGALAFLRNLRNMYGCGISKSVLETYSSTLNLERVLPFRYIAACKHVDSSLHKMLESMMFRCLESHDKLLGKTILLVDVSGSMFNKKVSGKSDLDRIDAAIALAILCREICQSVEIFTFSTGVVKIDKSLRGFDLINAIKNSQLHSSTNLGGAIEAINRHVLEYDRFIVFTDEQSANASGRVKSLKNYIINVGAYQNGINHYDWLTISGFSEAVIAYLQQSEKLNSY